MISWRRAAGCVRPLAMYLVAGHLIVGCAVNPELRIKELTGDSARRLPTAFFPQDKYQCGPAALAGVLSAAGVAVEPDALTGMVYLPERRGSLQMEMLAATRRLGRIAYVVESDPAHLIAQIESGRPVLVLQNLGTQKMPIWHYAVLTGFDALQNRMVLNSGRTAGMEIPARKFLRTWNWSDRWAMVALRPGELPALADPGRYAESVVAFERTATQAAAMTAWQAAADQWPSDPRPLLALGNLAYREGKLEQAVQHYRRGLGRTEKEPALANNLGALLGEMGCPRSGESLLLDALSALEPDSPWLPPLLETLDELRSNSGSDAEHCK